ncbi:MAG: hypothetical protein JO165_08085 [Candidatus Eremiobacteraeota bacterium]|nr:hypothetical protein [Candidatus Eremiobacteraeota bacterium]
MKHLERGELRRLLDEPDEFDAQTRAHAETCDVCAQQLSGLRDNAAVAAHHFSGTAPRAARRLRIRVAYAGIAAAAALVIALFTTPLGTYAQAFLTVFEPRQITPVAIDPRVLTGRRAQFPELDQLGTFREAVKPHDVTVASLSAAQPYVPFRLLTPTVLPPQVGNRAVFKAMPMTTESFTFDARKAQAYALRTGKARITVPPYLDGATLNANVGPMAVAFYGQQPETRVRGRRTDDAPFLMLAQSVAPKVTSTRATLPELKAFLSTMPGVTPAMKAEINALSEGSLPIPFRPDKQTAQNVIVQGAQGLAIGDNTGLGAGVVWTKNGVIYGAAGMLPERDLLNFVNGLR